MAGGEGTRLRPLTSNQPKPMVSVAGKPCMEHIIDLLVAHGITEVVVTLAYLPQVIRGYFDDGEVQGVRLRYSVEEAPLGTAGSVKNAQQLLDETFLVISGDALCDFDLTALIDRHRRSGATATLALKSVPNPLEFGVVIVDADGRVERFLEKPSWGQVFSDTINTGVYVLEPEVLRAVPEGQPYDFSKQLFPDLLARGKPVYGHVMDGYWQDIGNLDQYRQANFDALDGLVSLQLPGIRLRDNVLLGDGVDLSDLTQVEGPAFIGSYCKVEPGARIGPHSLLGKNVVVKEGAYVTRAVIDTGSFVGRSARVEGAVLGKGVDVRSHAVVNAGVAVGDECLIGAEAVLSPGIRVYPFKTIEPGAAIDANLIWESRGITTVFGRDGVSGLVNVDITPDRAARLGMAWGTVLPRGARIIASRDAHPASRMIKRAIISGVVSTGVLVSDLRVATGPVNRHQIKAEERAGGLHVGMVAGDPDAVSVTFFEPPGILVGDATMRAIERAYSRQEFRRVGAAELGSLHYPSRASESYLQELLAQLDGDAVRGRGLRLVLDYARSPAALLMPPLLGELGVEAISTNAFAEPAEAAPDTDEALRRTARLTAAVGADLGILMDNAGERIWLIDEQGEPIDPETALLLFVAELARQPAGGELLVPNTESRLVEVVAGAAGERVHRTASSLRALLERASLPGVLFAGASTGGYVFPSMTPAYDAVTSTARALELIARSGRSVSALCADLPRSTRVQTTVRCPWSSKAAGMRLLIESVKGMDVDTSDGVKILDGEDWAMVIPDPDQPLFHLYAEAGSRQESLELEAKYRAILDQVAAPEPDRTLN